MNSPAWTGDHYITQPFGCTSLTVEPWWNIADCHWHCGVDVGMPVGTPLYAARAGKIANVAYAQLGLTALGTNQTDWYIHIDRAVTAVGHNVAKGELIAYSGNKVPSGGATTGPHLHFEVQTAAPPWYNRPPTSVDPSPILFPTYTFGTGTAGDADLTPEQDSLLRRCFNLLAVGNYDASLGVAADGYAKTQLLPRLTSLNTAVQGLQATVATLKTSGGTGDNTAVLAAIGTVTVALDELTVSVLAVKSVTDKIAAI